MGSNGEVKTLNGKKYKNVQIVSGMNQEPKQLKPLGLRTRAVFRQSLMVILVNLTVFNTGIVLAYPAVTLLQLQDKDEPITLTEAQGSWFAAIATLACPFSGFGSGFLMDKIGRKRSILLTNVVAIIGWIITSTTLTTNSDHAFMQLMIGRFITGIAAGMASSPAGVYSAEVSHPKIRGRLTIGVSIAVAAGSTAIYIIGYFIRNDWRLISTLSCIYMVFAFVVLLFIPESPSWLLANGKTEEARKSLKYLRGLIKSDEYYYEEFEDEFNCLKSKATEIRNQPKANFCQSLRYPEVYKPLLFMIGFFACQQFSGIFVVIIYAVQFSKEAGVKIDDFLCAIFIGVTRLFTTLLIFSVLDKVGRRPPALVSAIGMAICMFLLACCSWFPEVGRVPQLSVVCVVLYIFFSTMGLMTLPFTMISEVYPQRVRGVASGITISFGYGFGFIIIKIYHEMVITLGQENVFAFFGGVSIFAIFFVYMFLPETKGKTLSEIEEYFKYGKKGQPKNEVEMKERLKC